MASVLLGQQLQPKQIAHRLLYLAMSNGDGQNATTKRGFGFKHATHSFPRWKIAASGVIDTRHDMIHSVSHFAVQSRVNRLQRRRDRRMASLVVRVWEKPAMRLHIRCEKFLAQQDAWLQSRRFSVCPPHRIEHAFDCGL
jgi:hypothetical protein